jgi:hypothetical protein
MYFRWYCDDLIKHGYLESFEREAEKFRVLPKVDYKREKHLKTKENGFETISLFPETNYTYDFRLIWSEKALYIFTEPIEFDGFFVFGHPPFVSNWIEINGVVKMVSYIDVKPHYKAVEFGGGKMKSYYTFPFIQKYLYMTKGLYINKTIPIHTGKHGISTCLFASTFTPTRYVYTDKSGEERKIPFRKKGILAYCEQKSKIVDELLFIKKNKSTQVTLL